MNLWIYAMCLSEFSVFFTFTAVKKGGGFGLQICFLA